MSMSEALRGHDHEWLKSETESRMQPPDQTSIVDEMAALIRLAGAGGQIDRESSTWVAVCSWAATELLTTFAEQESADDAKAAALRARAKVLRDLIRLNDRPQKLVKFIDQSPIIP